MDLCPDCGSTIENSLHRFCPSCGKHLDAISTTVNDGLSHPEQIAMAATKTVESRRSKKVILSFVFGFLLLILLATLINQSLHDSSSSSLVSRPKQNPTTLNIIENGYYLNIGLTEGELIEKLGKPTSINQMLYLYDDVGTRQMYGFKNDLVYHASYIVIGVHPTDVPSAIFDIMTDFEKNNFWRLSDIEGMKRYYNGKYEISIWPIKTDDGTYNISLMAFCK